MKTVWFRTILPAGLLMAIVFICFGRTLASYFLADDFSEVSYVGRIFQGDYKLLLADFTGNHMQTSVMKVYRPGATLALLFNYAIWHTTAWGYFLVNILFMLACAAMLYLLLRELTKSWEYKRSVLFALLSAALFAANPLHCEPVSFISSGDYLVSCFFCLLSLWCFVRNAGANWSKLLVCGVAAFWAAILCKEAAVGLATALFGIAYFAPEIFAAGNQPAQTRLRRAFVISAPLWISTIAYLALRFILLGTITGGYTAGLGSSLMSSVVQRLTNPETVLHVIFPLNLSVFGTASIYGSILAITYVAVVTCIIMKLTLKHICWRWLGLLSVWSFSAAAPLYQVWSLGANLEGGRFFFFLTIPLSILLPAMILAPHTKQANSGAETKTIDRVAVLALFSLVLIDTAITYHNNVAWVHAGRQTKACVIQGQKLAQTIPAGKKCVLLGFPQVLNGAHVIYNSGTFSTMMSPPFTKQACADKFVTFDPLFFGYPNYINAQRLKNTLQDPTVVGFYRWNMHLLRFEPLQKPKLRQSNLNTLDLPCGQIITSLNLDPYRYDFIEIEMKSQLPKTPIFLYWAGSGEKGEKLSEWCGPVQGIASIGVTGMGNIQLRVSDNWQWYTQGNISKLKIESLPGQNLEVLKVHALPGKFIMPIIAVQCLRINNTGVYAASKSGIDLNFDGSTVAGCAAIKIEVSKPYYFFEGLTPPQDSAAIMGAQTLSVNKGHVHIDAAMFPSSGYYQLRAVCADQNGRQIGEPSDPVTIGF